MSPMSEVTREDLRAILGDMEPYSDYTYGSLRYWDTGDRLRLSKHNGNLIVKFFDYLTGEDFYSLAGTKELSQSALAIVKEFGVRNLALIPEPVARSLAKAGWNVTEDRDSFDYILDLHEWMNLLGPHHRHRRQKLNSFKKTHGGDGWSFERIDDWSRARSTISEIKSAWILNHPEQAKLATQELSAIDQLIGIGHIDHELDVFVLSIGGKPEAFEIDEALGEEWGVCHFVKSTGNWQEAETFLEVLCARFLVENRDVRWLNLEQDLGLSGLRYRKLRRNPVRLLEKFTATIDNASI